MNASVRDVMTTRVVALRKDADFKEIVTALRQYRVSACPVIDDEDKVIGIVSEADLLFKETDPRLPTGSVRLSWRLAEQSKANAIMAEQLMTAPAISIGPGASLHEAACLMESTQIKRLPVIAPGGKLIGIVTRSDVLSVFERPDEEIWDEVAKVILDEEFELDPDSYDVTVRSGVVTIGGLVDRHETALGLLARIRHAEASSPCATGSPIQPETDSGLAQA